MSTSLPTQNMIFASVDLETTGLDPKKDRIIEIGIQIFDSTNLLDEFSTLVDPGLDTGLPVLITNLTGIESSDLEGQPSVSTLIPNVSELLQNKIIVGHNVGFDLRFLSESGFKLDNKVFDTWDLAYIVDFNSPDYSLETLLARYGIKRDQAHRALDDAKATAELFLKLIDSVNDLVVYFFLHPSLNLTFSDSLYVCCNPFINI